MNARLCRYLLVLGLIAGATPILIQPACAQITLNGGTGGLQLPPPPTVGDVSISDGDRSLLGLDETRIDKWESAMQNYQSKTDKELAASRQAMPSVRAEIEQIKRKNSGQTLTNLASDPHSRYFQLVQWMRQAQAAEDKERETLDLYQKKIATVRSQSNADRINMVADQRAIREDYKKYSDQAYQEQKELARWNLQQQWNLNDGYNGRAPSGFGGYGYGGYGLYGGLGGYRY